MHPGKKEEAKRTVFDRLTEEDIAAKRAVIFDQPPSQLRYVASDLALEVSRAKAGEAELLAALNSLTAWVTQLSEQSDSGAADWLNTLRRGHCAEYEAALAITTKPEVA